MLWSVVMQMLSTILELLQIGRLSDQEKDSADINVICIPYRAPNANAFAERWVRTVRDECLNKLFTVNQAHLRRVMREFVAYHNTARPYQGIDQPIPVPHSASATGPIRCRNVLGGIIHDYYREAA